ncbi:matrix protein [rice transitory yellowing virus]|uniref:Matrix protein n=1 Tax=Rice yellow stunt virus TaxID=59380 RepID=MATRX_RYSV|nr:matrix protein [rice transitory yellowing virus]Q98664.2 RecName: Full=Matrix protein [rice transitory yellowing virus]BAA25157.1 matrix protein [rice transitory yellowing virus]
MANKKIRVTGAEAEQPSILKRISGALTLNPLDYHLDYSKLISLNFMVKISFHDASDYDLFVREGITPVELFEALASNWSTDSGEVHYVDGNTHDKDEIDTSVKLCELITIIKDLPFHKSEESTHFSILSTSLTLGFGDQILQKHDNSVIPIITERSLPQYMHAIIQYEYPRVSGGIAATICAGICIRSPPIGNCPPIMKPLHLELLCYHYGLKMSGDAPSPAEGKIGRIKRPTERKEDTPSMTKRLKGGVGATISRMLSWKE